MRLALSCMPKTSNARYRAILPLRELERQGHTVFWPGHHSFKLLAKGGTPKWDVLHIQQFFGPEILGEIERLTERGIAVVWDTDDDVMGVPRGTEAYKNLGGRRKIRRIFERTVAIANAAHLMTTTNDHLGGIYRAAGVERVQTIENYVAPEDVNGQRTRHQGIVIGLVAAGEHEGDLKKMRIGQVLHELLRRYDGVRVVSIGADLKIRDHRYRHIPLVPIERLIDTEREFDIGLAPLLDTPFNRARSNIKLKEYAAAGAMWAASPIGPYVGMGEKQGGLLVAEGEWLGALSGLIEDQERRRELTQRSRAWVQRQTARQGADVWHAAYRTALLRARRQVAVA